MSLRRAIPAGVLDAGLESLGTFAVGVVATRILDAEALGVYAVLFTAFLLGVVVPMQLVYLPAEVRAVTRPLDVRTAIMRRSYLIGMLPSLGSLAAIGAALFIVQGNVTTSEMIGWGVTASAATLVVPAQAHLRRTLHLANASWRAATVSGVQLVAALAALATLVALDIPSAWVPFGALAIGEAVSMVVGLATFRIAADGELQRTTASQLMRSGNWLLMNGGLLAGSRFAAAAIIGALAGSEALGYTEAARLAAQPVLVLGVGLNGVLGPRSMEAGHQRDRAAAKRLARLFRRILLVAAGVYLLMGGGDWVWNPVAYVIPKAYTIGGLAALMILANAVGGLAFPNQRELLGGRFEKSLVRVELFASVVAVATSLSAGVTGAYSRPLATGAQNAWRLVDYQVPIRRLYAGAGEPAPVALTGERAD